MKTKQKTHFSRLLPISFAPGERNYCGLCGALWGNLTTNTLEVTCLKCKKAMEKARIICDEALK